MIIDILFIIVLILLVLINILIRTVAETTKELNNKANLSGFEIARKLTSVYCEEEPHIIKKNGKYLDYYNKERNVIKLSPDVFDGENAYAGIIAINTALEADPNRKNISLARKINAFLVLISYVLITLGSITHHIFTIRLGTLIFIVAFIIEFILLASLFKSKEELDKLYEQIEKERLIKPTENYKKYCLLLSLSKIATMPYSFINYFR